MLPQQIKKNLDEHVIGQDRAKKILSVALYNHMKRVESPSLGLRKSNVMLVGPSGSGKTLLIKTLARLFDVPFYQADATSLTAAGYIGQDVESIMSGLYEASGNDMERAERGIVFIDEVDKIKKANTGGLNTDKKDVGGEAVQQGLLKMLEGSDVKFGKNGNDGRENMKTINTDNILFIVGGAFVGLGDIADPVTTEQLIDYGMIPELMGRIPVVAQLKALNRDELRRSLDSTKHNPCMEYINIFDSEYTDLKFTDEALYFIVDEAMSKGVGARGMRSIIEQLLTDAMYDLPSGSQHPHGRSTTTVSVVNGALSVETVEFMKKKKRVKRGAKKHENG